MVTNISVDEHFGLAEFYKIPKKLADIDVNVDEHFSPEMGKIRKDLLLI